MAFVPGVHLNPMRRRLPAERAQQLLGMFPAAQHISLSGCLAPVPKLLDVITTRDASRVHSLRLASNGLTLEHAEQLGEWLAASDGMELSALDLSDNSICVSRGLGASAIDASGLRALLAPFAQLRTSRCTTGAKSPVRGGSGDSGGGGSGGGGSGEEVFGRADVRGSQHRLRRRAGPALLELNLSGNQLCTAGAQALASSFRSSPALTCASSGLRILSLAKCLIGTGGIAALLPALKQCCALSSLDLTSNFLYDEGASAVAPWLAFASPRLEFVSLAFNGIGEEGANALHAAIEAKQTAAPQERSARHVGRDAPHASRLLTANLAGNNWNTRCNTAFFKLADRHGIEIYVRDQRAFNLTTAY
ncbi:hypothetical protein T492DRAFT_1071452 [Pavlovales sp. CCMP2436]|nr:hypothetical protein T492DRAFT_1071452 [Pavlovales sp. CCMP2436]